MKKLLLFPFCLIYFFVLGQDTKKYYDEYRKDSITVFYSQSTGILARKVKHSNGDIINTLTLSINIRNVNSDDIAFDGAVIVFEDGSYLILNDKISINYFQEGKSQIYLTHLLTNTEIEILKSKKIDFFIVGRLKNKLDKWQKGNIVKYLKEFFDS